LIGGAGIENHFNKMTPRMKFHVRRFCLLEFQPIIEFYFEIL